jgi:hypothetical protein
MISVQRFDRAPLQFNPAGGSRVPGRIMRNGLLTYRTADGRTQVEWTPRAVLADAASGFNGAAVTRTHPPAGVTPSNWQDVAVGVVLSPKIVQHSDGYEYVEGLLDITRHDADKALDQGESELSAGYQVMLDLTPGIVPPGEPDAGKSYDVQRVSIAPNHVALLERGSGRAGREARLLLDAGDLRLDANGNQLVQTQELVRRHPGIAAYEQRTSIMASLKEEHANWQAHERAGAGETEAFNAKLHGLHGRELPSLVK